MTFSIWDVQTRAKRFLTVIAFLSLSLIIMVAGALTPLDRDEARDISKQLEEKRGFVKGIGGFGGTAFIFGNNFMLCLISFVPIAGPIFGCLVLYNTGVLIAAESITMGIHPLRILLPLLIPPFAWLELLAYSAAFAQSVWLSWRIVQGKGKGELINTCVLISICAIMLLVAAIIEMALILAIS